MSKATDSNATTASHRPRTTILGDIARIGPVAWGNITENTKTLADGTRKTYYRLQRWTKSGNDTTHIPEERVEEFRAAVVEKSRLDTLVAELCERDAESLRKGDLIKKKRRR